MIIMKKRARGFGDLITKNQKEIEENIALQRLSKDSLESLRENKEVNSQPTVVKVLNEADNEAGTEPVPASLSVTREELTAIAQLAAESAVKPLNDQIAALEAALESTKVEEANRLAAVAEEKEAAENKLAVFANLFKLSGNPEPVTQMPAVNKIINSKSDKPEGALAEFMSIQSLVRNTGSERFISSATPEHQNFVKENYNHLVKDLESYGKNNGLFRGRSSSLSSIAETNAITQISDLPGGFLETLSPIMREAHRTSTIFHQFADTRIDFTAGRGDTVNIYRSALSAPVINPDDYLLSGGGTYADIVSTTDSVQTGIVKIVVKEWGRGKPGSGVSPIGISRFTESFSLIEGMRILDNVLMHNYDLWEDLVIRRLWTPTSRIVYNGNNSVVTLPASVPTVAQGRCTWQFLNELYGYMRGLQIPTLADGCYGIALTTKAATQLKTSMGDRYQFQAVIDMEALTNVLNLAAAGEKGKVTGYLGKIENFHVFESNNFSAGATGTEGVRTETTGAGATTTRTNFAFGANTIARGVAEPFQLVADEVTNFLRRIRISWLSWEGFAAMDVDPTGYNDVSTVPQQLRVLDVRFTD